MCDEDVFIPAQKPELGPLDRSLRAEDIPAAGGVPDASSRHVAVFSHGSETTREVLSAEKCQSRLTPALGLPLSHRGVGASLTGPEHHQLIFSYLHLPSFRE